MISFDILNYYFELIYYFFFRAESEEFTEEELIATVNETAEQGLAFLGNWLGIFDKSTDNSTEPEKTNATDSNSQKAFSNLINHL